MAKFNIEVELDWVDGEDGYTIDEEIKEQVVSGIKDALLRKATTEAVSLYRLRMQQCQISQDMKKMMKAVHSIREMMKNHIQAMGFL